MSMKEQNPHQNSHVAAHSPVCDALPMAEGAALFRRIFYLNAEFINKRSGNSLKPTSCLCKAMQFLPIVRNSVLVLLSYLQALEIFSMQLLPSSTCAETKNYSVAPNASRAMICDRWVNVCGKLPSICSPSTSYSSENKSRSFAQPTARL